MQITEMTACLDTFAAHDRDRSMFQREFCRRLTAEPGFAGEKLDIGCGPDLADGMSTIRARMGVIDGVDPFPGVAKHPLLRNRWQGTLESADIPAERYDLAYAYNVVEHVDVAEPFFKSVRRVLKPGAPFWAMTPHGRHPFAYCVRLIQAMKMKKKLAANNKDLNDYPAYYRLNEKNDIAVAAERAGFTKLDLVYMPCVQWDQYFLRPFRFVPHLYDRMLGLHRKSCMLLLAYRLE